METTHSSSPGPCRYCGTPVESEHDYRRHLNESHDPAELGTIDRRRYERYRPEPNVAVEAGSAVADSLGELYYPVEAQTMRRFAVYGFLSSLFVAMLLGVGL